MTDQENSPTFKNAIFAKITTYSQKISTLGRQVRQRVFGFRRRVAARPDRWSLPVKVLQEHRLTQRRRAFDRAGGPQSSVAMHALNKARHKQQP